MPSTVKVVLKLAALSVLLTGNSSAAPKPTHTTDLGPRRLATTMPPLWTQNNCVYGTFYPEAYMPTFSYGAASFYGVTLQTYTRYAPKGIFGYVASFSQASDYTFFKAKAFDTTKNSKTQTRSLKPDAAGPPNTIAPRQQPDDRVQCRNENGISELFSRSDCASAAAKMANEKTAMSSCGGCYLIMVGPQNQLSSSNMPASDLQEKAQNILTTCSFKPSANAQSTTGPISSRAKPNYVLLLSKADGPACEPL